MEIGQKVNEKVISTGKFKGLITKEIVTKYYAGSYKGKAKYHSQTKHIRVAQ